MPYLHDQIKSVQLKIQADPDTPETLTADDADFFVEDVQWSPDIEQFPRQPYKKTLGSEPTLIGPRKSSLSFASELIGRGAATEAPPCDKLLRTAGFKRTDNVVRVPIGSISGGPFQLGEQVSQGAVTAIVSMIARNGDPFLFLHGESGGAISDGGGDITGADSGAVATPSAAVDASHVYMYRVASSGLAIATIGVHLGNDVDDTGLEHKMSNALANVVIRLEDGNRAMLALTYMGRLVHSQGVASVFDTSIPSHSPPQWQQDDALRIHESYPCWLEQAEIDAGAEVLVPKNANDASGFGPSKIGDRTVRSSMGVILPTPDEHDFYGKIYSNALDAVTFRIGTAAGNQAFIQLPRSQYTEPNEGSRDSQVELSMNVLGHETAGDDDLIIIIC